MTVEFCSYIQGDNFSVILLNSQLVDSSVITATLPVLDDAKAAEVYGLWWDFLHVLFTTSTGTTSTNSIMPQPYTPLSAPNITSVTSSSCDSVSALQLTNCHALASITITGSNLAAGAQPRLVTSLADGFQGANYLSPQTQGDATWYDSLTNTSLVFTLSYFDADTNVRQQPDVVYTAVLVADSWYGLDASNAFRLSLTYNPVDSSTSSSSKLSSGAIAGIVFAALVVAVLLALIVVWLLRRQLPAWSKQSSSEGPIRSDVERRSDAYKDVELQ